MYRIHRFIRNLTERQWAERMPLKDWEMRKVRYILPGQYEPLDGGEEFTVELSADLKLDGKHGITYFLKKQITIPAEWEHGTAGLTVNGGGEGLLRVNGASYQGLDRNHNFVPLYLDGAGLTPLLEIELYDPIPEPFDPLNNQETKAQPISQYDITLVRVNKPVQSLLRTVQAMYETTRLLPEDSSAPERQQLLDLLYDAMREAECLSEAEWSGGERLAEIENALAARVRERFPAGPLQGKMHMVGQSHIDIAWLWPVRETVRKVSRTFSTMTSLMEEYPDFVYSQSQPLLYAWVKERDPALYAKIKRAVAENRWELVGGMWIEPDLNIPSGESLVRQLLHGQLFYSEEFGKRATIEWLPDTFGYSASLPQLLKLAGMDYFMTTKLNWNDTNKFPHELFRWVGIDGTAIVSYLNHGVNEHTRPKDVKEHWEAYRQKDKLGELMLLYGHGDGGGGVTREMVEFVHRSDLMPGLPVSNFSTAGAFFDSVSQVAEELPEWHGDLYLELHRGTLTTHGRNKRYNRKAEVLYRDAEIWSTFARLYAGASDDVTAAAAAAAAVKSLEKGWKLMLLNQFHDIIPGTAITESYVTSAAEYEEVFAIGKQELNRALRTIAGQVVAGAGVGADTDAGAGEGTPYVVFNSLGWERDETVLIDGDLELAGMRAYDEAGNLLGSDWIAGAEGVKPALAVAVKGIPAFGYKTVWLRLASEQREAGVAGSIGAHREQDLSAWETPHYKLEFNERGEITRMYDKAAEREVLPEGSKANELQFFHDRPLYWDAWDIDPKYEQHRAGAAELVERKVIVSGEALDILRFEWRLNESRITQDLVLYHGEKRIDFKTRVQWHEDHKLLKVAFPVDVLATKATYEIPFGALERPTHRNTSWEQAQYEVCSHRWADVSEGSYGVSLLNDCKYGYDIKDSVLRLSLLRAPKWPDAAADQGEHEFTYSLLPHAGDWRAADVVRRAAELNSPAVAVAAGASAARAGGGLSSAGQTLLQLDSRSVILDTVKQEERGTGMILRFYESTGSRDRITLRLPASAKRASIVNLLEDELEPCSISADGTITLSFKPFEIKSVKVE
ncbi:alpha-mannosidase [Paenibacillus taihuensis]|uniref:alpha-mannosidase n=1 Tax=Paenibacillus taihuensis TaxID=1156355 RepID=A0A3D9S1J6_9BACL|nr:alpha-mannosidase [Paenibacillus taihuensis]REE86470.1 alpha-mannosidase [Paenibacillus taihuensis]